MRKIAIPFVAFGFALFQSCEEVGPSIDFSAAAVDTTFMANVETPQERNVIMEEATGVQCVNCPAGADIIKAIQSSHPGRVFVVSLHAGTLTAPLEFSQYDLRSQKAYDLYGYFGEGDPAKPQAVVDRVKWPTEGTYFVGRAVWSDKVDTRLALPAPVNITLTSVFDDATREAKIVVRAAYTAQVTKKQHLTVFLTEDEIIDAQEYPSHFDTFYHHKHVFRDMLTPINGSSVLDSLSSMEPGRVYERRFTYTVNNAWNADHCKIIAIIHNDGAGEKEVLQAAEIHLK